ncbi:MAG: alcohol dehydrogenase catalytic domain-containing protein [Myxococcales bacterium]|nr:alcohol dehydrogenase catalytic domain-containing protein [Myxococcales bacterium]
MATMKAARITKAGGEFEYTDVPLPEPGPGQVRIKVEACGICHSDAFVQHGGWPGLTYPRIPGHEVAGRVDAVGEGVAARWKAGTRVGVGWHGGHCFTCDACRGGDFLACSAAQICGISYDGGYAEYMVAPQEALALIPDALDAADAAPLLCAGITTFNALRNAGVKGGATVAVVGIGGLGHLGLQYANHLGYRTVALSRGSDKEALARELGAHVYIDTAAEDGAEALQKLGGADLVLVTAPNAAAMKSAFGGLKPRGKLLIVGAAFEPLEINPIELLSGKTVAGWPSGTPKASEETLDYSAVAGIKPMIETFPLAEAGKAYARMMNNEARFRVVLVP